MTEKKMQLVDCKFFQPLTILTSACSMPPSRSFWQ